LVDGAIRQPDPGAEAVRLERALAGDPERPGEVAVPVGAPDELPQGLGRELGSDLSGLVPAHPVRDHGEADPDVELHEVFVALSLAAGVGQAVGLDHRAGASLESPLSRSVTPVTIARIRLGSCVTRWP